MSVLNEISAFLQEGDDEKVFLLTKQAIDDGIAPVDILNKGLLAGMEVVGNKFRNFEIFLPDVLMAAKAMYAGMDQLKPLLIRDGVPAMGKIVIGTVQGDLHDIGKNLVGIMLKGAGIEVIDLGKDVPAEKFIETAVREKATVIGLSALLTTTTDAMKTVIRLLKEQGLDKSIKTIIGGAPVSEEFAREIGADAYAADATDAVEKITGFLKE
ncbi:MAG: cobalamin-binding protein [Calditrichales bacterium]|nr:MAG: cobalamin-binding protein [Calditrichales bacterium]